MIARPAIWRWFRLRSACAACLALVLGACEMGRAPPAANARSDKVSVNELHGEQRAQTAILNPPQARQLAFTGRGVFFHGVIGGVFAGPRIVVGNRFSSQIQVFDTLGAGVSVFGRAGGGPGEFDNLASVVSLEEGRIAAFDSNKRRAMVFDSSGALAREYAVSGPARSSPIGLAGAVGPLEAGELVVWTQVMPGPEHVPVPNQAGQVPIVLFSVDSAGAVKRLFGEFPGQEVYMAQAPEFGGAIANLGPAPFGRWTRFGVHGRRVFVLKNSSQDVEVYAPDGRIVSVYRLPWSSRRVKRDDRQRTIEEWVKRSPRQETWPERRKRFAQLVFPEVMPVYRDAFVGTDGILWIEPYTSWNGKTKTLVGFDSTGQAVGQLVLGYNERILQIGDGRLLTAGINEDGTENVRLHRFHF